MSRHASKGGGGGGGWGGGGSGVQGVRIPALLRYSPIYALKFLNQFRRNTLKSQFKKQKNPSKRCNQNAELVSEKLHLIRKLNIRIFNSMAVIFYLPFNMLSYFGVIHNL